MDRRAVQPGGQCPHRSFHRRAIWLLALEIDGERVQRAYSYVNAPDDANLEFYLVTVPEGKLSPRLSQLQRLGGDGNQRSGRLLRAGRGARLRYAMDAGDRHRHRPLFVDSAAGRRPERFNNSVLVHAARFARDLSYLPLMQQLQQRYNGKLRIQTVVSREEAPAH